MNQLNMLEKSNIKDSNSVFSRFSVPVNDIKNYRFKVKCFNDFDSIATVISIGLNFQVQHFGNEFQFYIQDDKKNNIAKQGVSNSWASPSDATLELEQFQSAQITDTVRMNGNSSKEFDITINNCKLSNKPESTNIIFYAYVKDGNHYLQYSMDIILDAPSMNSDVIEEIKATSSIEQATLLKISAQLEEIKNKKITFLSLCGLR